MRIELRVIVEQIRSLTKSIAELEKTIGEEGSKLEGHKSLSSIMIRGGVQYLLTGAFSRLSSHSQFSNAGRPAPYPISFVRSGTGMSSLAEASTSTGKGRRHPDATNFRWDLGFPPGARPHNRARFHDDHVLS